MTSETPSTLEILQSRGPRNTVDPSRPYAALVEDERSATGQIEPVATLFLTNRECPFRCLYCDLWKNTTDHTLEPGMIPQQISHALSKLPPTAHIKLYNSGNFFDPHAIPTQDHGAIAELVQSYRTVIVENHPRLTDQRVLDFRHRIPGEFEVAMGLETIHPEVLPRLNKSMTLKDFDVAAEFLQSQAIALRVFILLKPPYVEEEQGVEWAIRSVEYALDRGARVCCVIPTRDGNGIMELLRQRGEYAPPILRSLERVQSETVMRFAHRGRIFVDLWDTHRFATCSACAASRISRMQRINLHQHLEPEIPCPICARQIS